MFESLCFWGEAEDNQVCEHLVVLRFCGVKCGVESVKSVRGGRRGSGSRDLGYLGSEHGIANSAV